jgi:hypothetical protein
MDLQISLSIPGSQSLCTWCVFSTSGFCTACGRAPITQDQIQAQLINILITKYMCPMYSVYPKMYYRSIYLFHFMFKIFTDNYISGGF